MIEILRRASISLATMAGGLCLGAAESAATAATPYLWQQSQAEVLPTGDLRWRAHPFEFQAGRSVRYIDFENGDDRNSGESPAQAWKHHPWDPNATSCAGMCGGVHTYVFKRGVTYRGRLIARDAGREGDPIILTSDPAWGDGEAELVGSRRVSHWERGGTSDMPQSDRVWHADLDFLPRAVWMVTPRGVARLALARVPNWRIENWADIHSEWATWEGVTPVQRNGMTLNRGSAPSALGRYTPEQLNGAIVWSEYESVMGTAFPTRAIAETGIGGTIDFERWTRDARQGSIANNRFFLEDKPVLLDSPGEFWFDRRGDGGRLYVRLPADIDPTEAQIEAAHLLTILDATTLEHVKVRGLSFRFTNIQWDLTEPRGSNPDVEPAVIRLNGSGVDIAIENCRFEHVTSAVRMRALPAAGGWIDDVTVSDCEVRDTDHGAFAFHDNVRWGSLKPPYSTLGHIAVLRNKLERIGFRPYRREHGHAIVVSFARRMEVAGNMLDQIHGAGLFLYGGSQSPGLRDAPLSRHLVFQNRVNQPLLGTNDWGGIETWQAGPFYVFNNVSIDPGGYHHAQFVANSRRGGPPAWDDARFGFAYYLDGSSKNYVFNNLAIGRNNDPRSPLCNAAAFHEVLPQNNVFFNNTARRFAVAFAGGVRTASNSIYVGNLLEDISQAGWYFAWPSGIPGAINEIQFTNLKRGTQHKEELVLADNIFGGNPAGLGTPPGISTVAESLPAFREALQRLGVADARVGEIAPPGLLPQARSDDFRPTAASAATGRGARIFVPWGLFACVAEWNFRPRAVTPEIVPDDHWYLTWGYVNRESYADIPRHELRGVNLGRADFVEGPLDSGMPSAVRLDGASQYLVLRDADLYRPKAIPPFGSGPAAKAIPLHREHWRTPDVGTGNFLIEAYLRSAEKSAGTLVAKHDGQTGYILELDETGRLRLRLEHGGKLIAQRTSSASLDAAIWHHLVVEVDRARPQGISLWIDGRCDEGAFVGTVTAADLDNRGDVLVGGGPQRVYFRGEIDFLRLCLGTLAEAHTTIDELRAWEFSGPQFSDFAGNIRPFPGATAGALEERRAALTVVVLGSSTAAGKNLDQSQYGGAADGLAASWVSRYAVRLTAQLPGSKIFNLAKSGSNTFEALPTGAHNATSEIAVDPRHNITAALAEKPDIVILSFNALPKGSTAQENVENLARICQAAVEQGAVVWIATPNCPHKDADPEEVTRASEYRRGIIQRFGKQVLDFWPALSLGDGTADPSFLLADVAQHPNAKGHARLLEIVVAADIPAALRSGNATAAR